MLLFAVIGAARQALAQPVPRDTLHVVLVGRTESADIYLEFPAADTLRGGWAIPALPEPLGRTGAIYLRTVLPITIGSAQVNPGRYQLWIVANDGGADLILSAPNDSGPTPSGISQQRVRTPLAITRHPDTVSTTKLAIRTTRHGPDTLVVADRSTRQMDIRGTLIHPGTSSMLVIWIGDAELTVPISAR